MGRRDRLKTLSTSWTRRTLQSGRVAATLGKSVVKQALGHEDDGSVGEELLSQLERMKGLALKVGQMASYLEGALPPASAKLLEKLQQNSDPMDLQAVEDVITGSFGVPLDELFDSFDPIAIAAASIGQVHRAIYNGQSVAVKVQYPGVRDTLSVDLGNLSRLGGLARFGFSDARDVVDELRQRFEEECDYRLEADNTELAARLLANDPCVFVPAVVHARSTDVVLTTSWVEGRTFQDFLQTSTQAQRNHAGQSLFRTAFGLLFHHGVLNADPHPGNVLFTTDDRIAILDWGCMCRFDSTFINNWKNLAHVTLEGRRDDFEEATQRCGFAQKGAPFDYDVHWEVMQYLYRPFLTENFTYTPEYVRESWSLFLIDNPNLRHTRMPREWTFTNRLQWGLNSVLASLQAQADWGALYREALNQPTRPVIERPLAPSATP